ncbi:MAG: GNAT family N-acetyltransferase [Anaeroplasmataceae bacterium]
MSITLDLLNNIDNKYVSEFSKVIKVLNYEIYHDNNLENKYFHNYIYLPSYTLDDIKWYYNYSKKNKYPACVYFIKEGFNIIDFSFFKDVEVVKLLYMYASINIKNNLKYKKDVLLKQVDKSIEDDFIGVLYMDNRIFGDDYSMKNALRYKNVIIDNNSKIKYYFMYDNSVVIGYISVLADNDIIKIEDFSILKPYRKQGYGETLFKYILELYKNYKYVYLVADYDDTPKNMYKKWGFKELSNSYLVRVIEE